MRSNFRTLLRSLGTLLLSLNVLQSVVHAITPCGQEFIFEGKTAGEYSVLMLTERRYGECGEMNKITLYLGPDKGVPAIDFGQERSLFKDMIKARPREEYVELRDSSGVFRIADSSLVKPPRIDSAKAEHLLDYIRYGGYELTWYKDCTEHCFDEPVFEGVEATLVFAHFRGLYKNYSIQRALFFPQSQYLLIITHQPIEFAYGNTLHGVLLYKLGF